MGLRFARLRERGERAAAAGGRLARASEIGLPATPPLESTAILLARVREGDDAARAGLLTRYLPLLQRWAHGRLPAVARGAIDTDDLVQATLVRALDNLESFEPRREGALLAYLRTSLLNAVRDELRRVERRPRNEPLDVSLPDPATSLVEQAIGRQAMERYEAALAELPEQQREAVILRVELGYSHREVADAVGCPSADAARMLVSRALVRIAESFDG